MKRIAIQDKMIGRPQACFIIAEAGVNHNGSLDLAHELVDAAVEAGATAVKFQTFKADRLVSSDAPKARYQKENTQASESQYEMLKRLELDRDAYASLKAHCKDKNIVFLSTPFDEQSADLLDSLGVAAFKLPSGELTNLPFLRHVAHKRKPLIVSTGMATLAEVDQAVRAIQEPGNEDIVLLHCVSNYPAEPADVNLRAMHTMEVAFDLPVGYSDHTLGIEVPLAAVAVGACVIEKHFTLERTLPGPDHKASLEPHELKQMISGIRTVEAALGSGRKQPVSSELETASVVRNSLVAACDLPAGTTLQEEHITMKRPGTGLPPMLYPHLVGRTLSQSVTEGTLFTLDMF